MIKALNAVMDLKVSLLPGHHVLLTKQSEEPKVTRHPNLISDCSLQGVVTAPEGISKYSLRNHLPTAATATAGLVRLVVSPAAASWVLGAC